MIRAFCAMLLLCSAARAADLRVVVSNVRNARGHVLVAVCARADFLRPHCPFQGSAPAHRGDVAVEIKGVPPGDYAAQAFHDEDDNGRLERSFLGLPEEGMGFSRNAPMRFGPPDFADAAFSLTGNLVVGLALRYY